MVRSVFSFNKYILCYKLKKPYYTVKPGIKPPCLDTKVSQPHEVNLNLGYAPWYTYDF